MFGKKAQPDQTPIPEQAEERVSTQAVKQKMSGSSDVYYSDTIINSDTKQKFTIIFIDGLVDQNQIDNFILKPLIQENALAAVKSEQELMELITLGTVYHSRRSVCSKLSDCLDALLDSCVLMVFDTLGAAIAFAVEHIEKRAITEPTNENVLKGSKESFIEVLRVNMALVRRRIKTSSLINYGFVLGQRTHTAVSLVYLDGIANQEIVNKVKQRLEGIDIDGIISAGQIETFLMDNRHSFFPQILYTERVDKFCANLLEGRIGILIDGLPVAYITPVDLTSFMQAPEDYSLNNIQSTAVRLLRHICAFSALTLPAFYSAITTFHQEMIPNKLAISIISSKQGVPFPTFIEVILMLLAFEVLLEAGLRLPRTIGQAVSIVGAIVIGQAAISANILSPGVVIVISAAGITGFVIPSQDLSNAIRLCRLILVLLSTVSGLFTVIIGLILLLYHLCTLEIFGVSYLSPYVSRDGKRMFSDSIIRKSWAAEKYRPGELKPEDTRRQGR